MKKITIVAITFFLGGMFLSSCKKCTSCIVTKTKDGTIDKVYPEYCGSSTEVTNFENAAKATYYNSSNDKFVTCTRK